MTIQRHWIKIVIPFFLMFILINIVLYYSYIFNTIEQDKELINIIYQEIHDNGEINFQSIINFQWDRISTNITFSDHISLLIFLYNNQIVSYVDYPRTKGDFTCLLQPLELNNLIFNKEDAKFIIYKAQSRFCVKQRD